MYFDTYNHGSPLQNGRIFIIKLLFVIYVLEYIVFLIENYLYELLRLSNTALPMGTWQWDPGKSDKKFLFPHLFVVSSKFKPSFLPGFPLKLTKLIHSVFLQFSSSFPLVFLQFLGLIEAKTFLLQHFVETRAV